MECTLLGSTSNNCELTTGSRVRKAVLVSPTKNLPNYLDNTMFTKLVETGLIGTTGTSTDLVHQQIIRSFIGRHALAVGVLGGDEMVQSVRNRKRRNRP